MISDSSEPLRRPLANVTVGISISDAEPEELASHGLEAADVIDVTEELCRRLVSLGARVVLGHQWRPAGIMERVTRFAHVYQPESSEPIILNFLAYPDRAALSDSDRRHLQSVVRIYDEDEREALPKRDALRQMRERMAEATNARICLCGKLKQPEGFVPGLLEEAALTLKQGQPVYVSKMMGGSAALLARFLAGERDALSGLQSTVGFGNYADLLASFKLPDLAKISGLNVDELRTLFDAQNLDTIVHLTAKGLFARRGTR